MSKATQTRLLLDIEPEALIASAVKENVQRVLNTGRLFRYDCKAPEESETSLLEKEFAAYVGCKYAIAVNSCSSALFLSLLCTGVKPGDSVFIPAFTFSAVPSAVVHANATPLLIDIDENYSIDILDFEQKVKNNREVKHLLLSYMRGYVPNLDEVCRICDEYGIRIIEDCAHSIGVCWDGKQTGTFGITGAFSMQSYKMLDGGEGGMLVTDSDEIAAKAILYAGSYELSWKNHFLKADNLLEKYQTKIPNFNFRMSNLSAAAIRPQLDQLDTSILRYNEKYMKLTNLLQDSEFIRIPQRHKKLKISADSIQFSLIDMTEGQMINFLSLCSERGVSIQIMGISTNNARCFWNWHFLDPSEREKCTRTREILNSTCDLRLRGFFTNDHIETIGRVILEVLAEINTR